MAQENRDREQEPNRSPDRQKDGADRAAGEDLERQIEASETDGKGTGGVGDDAGGYGRIPDPDPGA